MNITTQLNNFLRYLTLHGLSQKSLKYYKSDLSHFLAWTEGRSVSNSLIREYINSQRMITPASTLNRRLSTLRSYSNFIGKDIMSGIENVSNLKDITTNKFKASKSSPYTRLQELILSKFEKRPRIQNVFTKLFFNRPNWYRRYHSYPLATYIHIAILILFTSISGYAVYDQVFYSADRSLAFPTALTRPNRYLSFQGRLTDNLGNPKTVATDMVFKLYSASSGGVALWDSGTCSITPDQDGIFSTLLGSSCGAEIASSVFSENAAIWLGATMGVDAEATPRVQIATVAYALNAETLQGFPAGTGTSTIPYINSSGSLVLANASPKIQSTSGTFAVEGQALTITTPNTSDGIITINPDGVGTLDLVFEGAAPGASANGFLNATNANITSGSLYSGTVASNATGYNFINFLSGASPTSKFSVDSTGLTTVGADLYVLSGISTFGNAVSTGTIEATKFCTGDGETNCVTDFSSLGGGGSGDITAVGSMTTGDVFADSSADDDWLGLGGSAGRIEFDDQATDEINILAANLGVGTTAPDKTVEINSATGANLRLTYNDSDGTAAEYADFSISSSGDLTINPQGNLTVTTDGTGNGEVVLPNDSIGPDEIFTTGQTDEYCLTYEATGTTWAWQSCGTAGSTSWSDLTAPTANLALSMAAYTTALDWTSTGALDAWTNNFNNNSTSSTTQNALVINNAVVGSFTDTATENLILLQQLDTTAAGTTALTNAFKIDSAGNSGITNGINITNSAGDITTGININDTAGGTIGTGIALSGTFTVGIDAGNSIITNIGNSGTDFTATGGLNLAGAFDANGQVDLGDGGDLISIYGSDTNIELVDGSTFNIDGDGGPTADLVQIGNGDISVTSGVDALNIAFAFSDASGDLIHLSPTYAGGATDLLTLNVFEIDAFSPTNVSGTDTVNGIRLGNLTDPGATIASTAFSVGTGWDTILGGTTAGTNILSFTNATLTSAGNLSLAGTTGLTFSSTGGVNLAGGTISDSTDEVDINDDLAVSGILQVGGTAATTYSRFGTSTTGHGFSAADDLLVSGDMELDGVLYLDGRIIANSNGTATMILAADPAAIDSPNILDNGSWWVNNNVNNGIAALMVNQAKGGDIFSASQSGTTKFTIQNDGDVLLTNQLQLGNLSSVPTPVGPGSMYFNTVTNTNQCYNGTSWYNCGGTLYSNTNASVADGSYITVTHNLATNDLLSSAWINAQGVWKDLDASYKPAIAWEGKDTERGVYHNEVNLYQPSEETNKYTENLVQSGLYFDTIEDGTKLDSANTTASLAYQMGDDGSANYATLNQRVQSGRVGLMGGQTFNTSNSSNTGHTYLGSNTVNDIYYYDRTKDSVPEVLVELGIDPNWYNGVTLSVATGSASYSQNGTVADKNPNLTTSYNGSLIKATGTDSEARTIYITIKSPTTFEWTNYQGDSSAVETITPGTAQTLGLTNVSVTFSDVNYNVGDVFKIASWYIEPSSTTRGPKQQFPERSSIVAESGGNGYVDIIDADTQNLWMRFIGGTNRHINTTGTMTSVNMLNGTLYATSDTAGLRAIKFYSDFGNSHHVSGGTYSFDSISLRNTTNALNGGNATNSTITIVSGVANDVATAVIPNAPTQEVTVSGWGYIVGDATAVIEETVNLPYKFNSIPNVVTAYGGAGSSGVAPTSLESCTTAPGSGADLASANWNDPTTSSFQINLDKNSGTFSSSFYFCYTWTATGTVSPKQFVAVATGATSADGGTTIINETDGTKADIAVGSQIADALWVSKVAFAGNSLYNATNYDTTTDATYLDIYRNVHGITSDASWAAHRSGVYEVGFKSIGWSQNGPTVLGTTPGYNQITSLSATANTSTNDPESNTIYVGTTTGVSVIQEIDGKATTGISVEGRVESGGSVKYYTKDNITEEMIGDVRGMWSLNNDNSSTDFEDNSLKGETLTGTNITANGDSTSGVRNTATSFDGSTEYMSCTDANCGGTTELDYGGTNGWTISAWVKPSSIATTDTIISKAATNQLAWQLALVSGVPKLLVTNTAATWDAQRDASVTLKSGEWSHIVGVFYPSTRADIYVNGQLANGTLTGTIPSTIRDTTANVEVASVNTGTQLFHGALDEIFVTAAAPTGNQIKNMYQVGYRALQSHGTPGNVTDSAQQLGYISTGTSSVGVVAPDWNNQYMYVGLNSTTLGGLSKIQLNSDSNIKTYNSSANVPTGGALLIDEDVTSLGVGYNLEAVGSAASGVKSMGFDNNSTATSGNFVSKTMALPKNIGSAVLWVSPIVDANDGSNTFTVKASNDGGSNYVTCTLVNTNSNPTVAEREYACTFATADNDLKVKFEFVRGSTKTNTYVTQYGISWLGETGFRVEQVDTNNVRLYNFSGETQNLKLNVTGASTTNLANPWTDAGSYLYPTGYEALRIYDGAGTNYLGISHDGILANLTYNGTTVLSINSSGDMLPNTNDAQNLGSDTKRWKDIFLGGDTMHIGTSTTDEATIAYNTSTNVLGIGTDSTTNGDIAFFTNDLYLDKSTGNVGIGTTTPGALLEVYQATALGGNVGDTQQLAKFSGNMGSFTPQSLNIFSRTHTDAGGAREEEIKIQKYLQNSDRMFISFHENDDPAGWSRLKFGYSTTDIMTINEVGNVGIGTTDPQSTLHVNGSIIGGTAAHSRTDTANTTTTITTEAMTFFLHNNSGTQNSSVTETFNITGVPDVNGAFVFINARAQKGITAGAQTSTVRVEINGELVGTTATTNTTVANTVRGNYTVIRTNGNWKALGVNTADSADLAEWINTTGDAPKEGQLVSIDPNSDSPTATIATTENGPAIGIVSTSPFETMGDRQTASIPLALQGRVPTIVHQKSGTTIESGDPITLSEIPGVGEKATTSAMIVGKALEPTTNWNADNCPVSESVDSIIWPEDSGKNQNKPCYTLPDGSILGKIMVFVGTQWYEHEYKLSDLGDLIIQGEENNYAVVDTSENSLISKISVLSQAVIGKLKAGFGSFKQIETSTISPVADSDLIIDLQPDDARSATKFAIKGNDNQEVAVIDADGNAEFDGTVTSTDLAVTNDATIAGTLYADNIESTRLSEIENLLAEVESNQTLLSESQNWDIETANNINVSELIAENIFVTGNASVTSLFVAENLTAKSLDSIDEVLSIQSLAIAPVEIMAGRIIIDTNGNTKFLGNIEVAGNLKLDGNFVVASDISEASQSAEIVEGQINSNATAGTAKLDANTNELKIVNNKVKTNSLIYVTPVTSTQNKVLFVKSKDTGEFTVGFSESIDTDVEFNWWIIELGNTIEEPLTID